MHASKITRFNLALPWIFDAEGGYVNDTADRGGATKYGISLQYLRLRSDGDLNRDGVIDINDILWLSRTDAAAIYRRKFWDLANCGAMPPHVALCLFDARVNHRPKSAAMLVQQALGVASDGVIGDATIRAARASSPDQFLPNYMSLRAQLFADIVRANSTQAKFERGWYRRLFLLHAYLIAARGMDWSQPEP